MVNRMLYIDREDGSWGKDLYKCRACNAESDTVSTIPHDDNCPVKNPDNSIKQFSWSTEQQILRLMNRAIDIYRQPDRWPEPEDFDDIDGVKWTTDGSTSRTIIGLGRTSKRGEFHMDDHRGVVLKVDPQIRMNEDVTGRSGNIDELHTYETAVQTGDSEFFADILACARDGAWLVMEYCIPIHPTHKSDMYHRDGIWDQDNDYIPQLLAAMKEEGWSEFDYKHGNIGLGTDGVPRFIDYGTGPVHTTEDS